MKIKSFKSYQAIMFGRHQHTHFQIAYGHVAAKRGMENITMDLVDDRIIIRDHKTKEQKIVFATNVAEIEPLEWISHEDLSDSPIKKEPEVALPEPKPEVIEAEVVEEETSFKID